ncbi:MAG: DNA primase, partial [Alphaproteobacteria bacterium]|nr:DNA primase [Alphaproteobacteria bacterium]
MAFSREFIQDIKDRISVSDVVGRKVRLQRRGKEHVGLSPFKSEKTPSFTVNDQKQFYHCFASGKHGSIFDFLMETEGLSFLESVERLANEAGLAMPQRDPRAAEKSAQRANLAEVMTMAADWFNHQLTQTNAEEASAYLQRRGVDAALIKTFGIGYAPSGNAGLVAHLQAKKVPLAQMVEANLATKPDNGGQPYDRFRDRIMFPIKDKRDKVIAFGGRAMQADAKAKYLNSSETPLFHKGSVLYNFSQARQAAYDTGQILVTEGYMDVVGLARGGIMNAVASLGTAITAEQIGQLWQLAPEPIICMDGDEAGLKAAYRVIDRALPLLKAGFSLRFAHLPVGKDPDDIINEQGRDGMNAILSKTKDMVDMLWTRESEIELNSDLAKTYSRYKRITALKRKLRESINSIGDKDVRALYGQEFAKRLANLREVAVGESNNGFEQKKSAKNKGQYKKYKMPVRGASRALLQSSIARADTQWL